MALGTLATIALGVSAASGVKSALDARKSRKEQAAALSRQRTEAQEAAKRRDVRTSTGAEVVLGSDVGTATASGLEQTKRKKARSSVLSTAGGLGTSRRIGL